MGERIYVGVGFVSIIIGILMFGLIVVVHEFGHFIAARKSGILVEEFAVGMGPILFKRKFGETLYTLRALPLGGFCRMLGDDGNSSDDRAFNNKSVYKRILVIVAGSFMNFVLAFIIFVGITSVVPMVLPVVYGVMPGMPAEAAGLQSGDRIVRVNDTRINIRRDMAFLLREERPTSLEILRGNERIVKEIDSTRDPSNTTYMIGIDLTVKAGIFQNQEQVDIMQGNREFEISRATVWETIHESFYTIIYNVRINIIGLGRLFTAPNPLQDMAGPIGVVNIIGDVYQDAIEQVGLSQTMIIMFTFTATISAAIGLFNLLPLPALDGGRLIFLIIEMVRRKPIDSEKEGMVHFVGFVLLMILAVFIAYNDISRIL